ncbi:MAG: lipid-binding SYLF domain-containing protein [Pirellulaceae bacterium]|nr:lipid-binding SYLF domain-containing protein [Pirellulaceae bacterium]
MIRLLTALATGAVLCLLFPRVADAKSEKRIVEDSATVLKEFLDLRVKGIPAALLAEAHGVAIIPDVIKVGFVVGGQRGKGVVIVREKDGSWRAPTFVTITGGSIGWQAGAQASDIVLVFKTQKSVDGLLTGKFTIGADAAAAAGPVGRRVEAATDAQLRAEIYSYSRSRGLFAGVSIDGSALQIDDEANAAYYGKAGKEREIPQPAMELIELIARATAAAAAAAAAAEPAVTPIETLPMPGPTLAPPVQPGTIEAVPLRADLARHWSLLESLVDARWREYLAPPAEVLRDGAPPSYESLKTTLNRFDAVAADPQYRTLAGREEFQATHDLLKAYVDSLAPPVGSRLVLPPPPGTPR